MGLKENFSQAVKELTGNTKEDDKKRNAQVAGLKKALDNDASFSEDERFTEGTGRPYYRDAQQYDNRSADPRDMRQENAGRADANARPNAGNERGYNDGYGQNGYQRPANNDNYRQQNDRNGGYSASRQDNNYGVRNYDSYDNRNDRSYDGGRQDNYNNDPYNNDRGYNGQPYNDNRNDGYGGQPYNDSRNDGYNGQPYNDSRNDGYNGQPYNDSRNDGYNGQPYNDNRYDSYGNQGVNDRTADRGVPSDNRQSRRNDDNQRGDYNNPARNDGYDRQNDYAQRGNYDNNRQTDSYGQQRSANGGPGSAAERNYNVRSFNNQQRYSQQNQAGGRTSYPMGNISRRDYREGSDNELTVISRNTIIEGNVRSFANMSIDGDIRGDVETTKDIDLNGRIIGDIICSNANMMISQVQGNIQLKGDVEIGRDTLLIGDLNSGFAKINGKIKGNVEVTGKAEFKADAVVFGDISASTITVDDGAIIEGYVSTTFLNKEESEKIFPESIEIGE